MYRRHKIDGTSLKIVLVFLQTVGWCDVLGGMGVGGGPGLVGEKGAQAHEHGLEQCL